MFSFCQFFVLLWNCFSFIFGMPKIITQLIIIDNWPNHIFIVFLKKLLYLFDSVYFSFIRSFFSMVHRECQPHVLFLYIFVSINIRTKLDACSNAVVCVCRRTWFYLSIVFIVYEANTFSKRYFAIFCTIL